jgi:hypothetical protein
MGWDSDLMDHPISSPPPPQGAAMPAGAFNPDQNHLIPRTEAAQLVGGFRRAAAPGSHLSTAFNRSAFEKLLGQEDCAGIRIYRATHEDGTQTLVMVGVNASGADLAGADHLFAQAGQNCPPVCFAADWF